MYVCVCVLVCLDMCVSVSLREQVERLVEMSSTCAIKEWRRLPMIVSQVHVNLLQVPPCSLPPHTHSVIFVNENENGEKRENNEFVNEN